MGKPPPRDVSPSLLEPADEAEFLQAVHLSRSLHDPWIDLADTPARFASMLERFAEPDQRAYLLRHRPCGGLVGYVSVGNIVRGALRSAYLGYAAFAGHDRRGLMTQGVRAVIDVAWDELALHRVEANIQPDNEPSLALVRRLGFEKEGFSPRYLLVKGEWRDHERWALREEICAWRTQRVQRPVGPPLPRRSGRVGRRRDKGPTTGAMSHCD